MKKDGEIKKNPLVADDLTEENNLYFLLVNIYITYRYMTKFTYCLITLYKVASFKLTHSSNILEKRMLYLQVAIQCTNVIAKVTKVGPGNIRMMMK